MLNEFDLVVFTQEFRGYPAGTKAYYIGSTIDSGYTVAQVAIVDKNFSDFLCSNGFDSLEDHLANKKENCIFGLSQWYNPFTIEKPYFEGIASQKQATKMAEFAKQELKKAQEQLEQASIIESFFAE